MSHPAAGRHHPRWTLALPPVAVGFAALVNVDLVDLAGAPVQLLAAALLIGAVFAAVHHAEVIAHRVGQPIGSLVLAIAVTVIEVSLIISIMLATPGGASHIARDTVFAAVMIVLSGIVGICLLAGGVRHHEQGFQVAGATGALGVLATLASLALILPNYTISVPGPYYSPAQLVFVSIMSLVLYFLFLFVQSVRHRPDFLDAGHADDHGAASRPPAMAVGASLALLAGALVAVVLIAEDLSPVVQHAVALAGLPAGFVGVVIAAVILLPEGIAAYRAAASNRLQTSLNLALGSALASIGLTIPAVSVASLVIGTPLDLGIEAEHTALLVLVLFISTLTLGQGRTTVLQGGVHLVIFAAFLTIAAFP